MSAVPVEIREGDFDAFFEASFACYGDDHPYVSPLKGDFQNRFHARTHCSAISRGSRSSTAHRGGRIVGRILAHIHDESNRRHKLTRGYFGWFDCIDDLGVAEALLDAAGRWVEARGCTEIAGNFNLSITQVIGIVTEGFDHAAYTYQQANPPHVPALLERLGFERFFPMRTFELDVRALDPDIAAGRETARASRRSALALHAHPAPRLPATSRGGVRGAERRLRRATPCSFRSPRRSSSSRATA